MPRQEHVITVFVSSPGDVGDERTMLEEVVRELNITWSRESGIRFDLVRWETHAYPGIGEDAQAVINEQIPDDYDVFVGIMWCRYGTATGRSGSGTVEEFDRAKARYYSDPTSVRLMIYFKDEALPPSRVDPTQLTRVNDFRRSLGEEGLLYWNFTSQDQFKHLVRLHLTRQLQAWKSQLEKPQAIGLLQEPAHVVQRVPEEESFDDELGVLDLIEVLEDRFQELTVISERIGEATEDLAAKITERTNEMNQSPRNSQGNVDRKVAKRLISNAATDMEEYTARMETELPLFSDALAAGMNALVRIASMSIDFETNELDMKEARGGLQAITTLRDALTTAQVSIVEFRQIVAILPRMTSELNRAKRGVVSVLDMLINEFSNGQSLLHESENVIQHSLGDKNGG